jgi:hypothetical protein
MALASLGGAVASAGTAAAGTAAAGTASAGVAAAGTASKVAATVKWSRVTPAGTNLIDDIGLARGKDGVLHVLWTTDSASNQSIMDIPISAKGAVGKPVTIAKFFLATDPDAVVTPTGLAAIWNGIKADSSGSPTGTFQALRPPSGGHFAVSASHVAPLPGIPFTSSSDTAATGSDGKPWVAFVGTDSLAVDHFGHPEVQLGPTNKCCAIEPGLATDGKTGSTWVTYASLINHHEGVFARRLLASGHAAGAAQALPGSSVGGNTLAPEQRVGTTGRGKGRAGVYAAYAQGFPFARSVDVLKLGSHTPVKVATFKGTSKQLGGSTLTANPNGRLWAVWFLGRGTKPALFVRESNIAATKWGKTVRVPLPSGTTTVWKVYVNAQSTKLDVLALLTKNNSSKTTAYWHAQVAQPK